jgi:hypothetical protein
MSTRTSKRINKQHVALEQVGFSAVGLNTWTFFSTGMIGAYLCHKSTTANNKVVIKPKAEKSIPRSTSTSTVSKSSKKKSIISKRKENKKKAIVEQIAKSKRTRRGGGKENHRNK